MIKIELVNKENFDINSLDDFVRTQKGEYVYQKKNGKYVIVNEEYTMDWSLEKKRDVASDLMSDEYISYIALDGKRVIGFVSLVKKLVEDKMILDVIQVSQEYRRQGLGKLLFFKAIDVCKSYQAKELYFSAFPGKATISFYLAMGAIITSNPIRSIEEDEPFDVQMTYILE